MNIWCSPHCWADGSSKLSGADQIRAYVVKMWKLGPENYVAGSEGRPIQAYTATLLTHVHPKLQLSKSSVFSRVIRA